MKKEQEQKEEQMEINHLLDSVDYSIEMRVDPLTTSERIKSELNQLELDRANREKAKLEAEQKAKLDKLIEEGVQANLMSAESGKSTLPGQGGDALLNNQPNGLNQ